MRVMQSKFKKSNSKIHSEKGEGGGAEVGKSGSRAGAPGARLLFQNF